MSHIYLKIEAYAGSSVDHVALEATALANRIGINVSFNFNGVLCVACPGDNGFEVAKLINICLQGGFKHIGQARRLS